MTRAGTSRRWDSAGSATASALFSFALGVSSVALPLLALADGYSYVAVGVLTAVSGAAQLAVRGAVPALSRRVSDRRIVAASGALIGVSCVVVALSTAWLPFLLCQALQGAARGVFWTGSQLHAVRTERSSLRGIARINLFTSLGLLSGPAAGGLLAQRSITLALLAAAGAGLLATVAAGTMTRLPVLRRVRREPGVRTLTHPRVLVSCWLSAAAGAWNAVLVSYVPLLLAGHQPVALIGILVTLANAGTAIGSYASGRTRPGSVTLVVAGSVLANGIALCAIVFAAPSLWLSAVGLTLGGLGAGALVTLGPALASATVADEQKAGAIALSGAFRAGALLLTPLGIAGALSVVPLSAAVGTVGALLCLPAFWSGRAGARSRERPPVPAGVGPPPATGEQ